MAVYTPVSAEALTDFLARYDVGELVSAKGIAEGIENTNYLVETTRDRFILTLYEKRVDPDDLPFFVALLDHLAARGNRVPRMLPDRAGRAIQTVAGRTACLIEFLPGVSPSRPTPAQAQAAGAAQARMHRDLADFVGERDNPLGPGGLLAFASRDGFDLDAVRPGLQARAMAALSRIGDAIDWDVPRGIVHGDLFPDNVLMLGDQVTGLIDFYFAATGPLCWDLAVTHSAWTFDASGERYDAAIGQALVAGYESVRPLTPAERTTMPVMARAAAMRFALTRAWDWLHTPADAIVTRKDPFAYWRRLEFYETHPEIFA